MPRKELLRALLPIALEAGEAVLRVYRSDFTHEVKDDFSPLTRADTDSQDVIQRGLSSLSDFDFPLLSEEADAPDFATRSAWSRYWLVDPLDGTREFVNRNGEFTINIALVESGEPVLGVVYAPELAKLYFGARGVGAWCVDKAEAVAALQTGSDPFDATCKCAPRLETSPYIVVGSRSHRSETFENYLEEIGRGRGAIETLGVGSSLKFCMVAQGAANEYPRFGPTMEWDTAAGDAIVRAVGGCVLDANTREPLCYNKAELRNPSFICFGEKAAAKRA